MSSNTSPLESLTAFALALAAGALSAIGLLKYIEKVEKARPDRPYTHQEPHNHRKPTRIPHTFATQLKDPTAMP